MIPYRVLYYPDFVPDALWLKRILLLADEVVRIVPDDVEPADSDDLLRLQEAIPGCLTNARPEHTDVSLEDQDQKRLAKALEIVRQQRRSRADDLEILIENASITIPDHVFVHDAKLSEFIIDQLRHNELIVEDIGQLRGDRFLVVQKDASDLILAGLATRIATRLGIDAVTDKPLAFATSALQTIPQQQRLAGNAEGALLSVLSEVSIPDEIENLNGRPFRDLRESYSEIRQLFKQLTAQLAQTHRLTKIDDTAEFIRRTQAIALDFERRCTEHRESGYGRHFKKHGPIYIASLLALPAAYVDSKEIATLLIAGGVVLDLVAPYLDVNDHNPEERAFNMLAGLRRDILKQSKWSELL